MLKSLVDIDVRKVAAVCGILIAFAVPISQDAIPNVPLADLMPLAAVAYVKSYAGLTAWICGIVTGAHNIAALISPSDGADSSALQPPPKVIGK